MRRNKEISTPDVMAHLLLTQIKNIKLYHCLKGVASIWTTAFLTNVFVRTSSLLLALYTTSKIFDFLVIPEKWIFNLKEWYQYRMIPTIPYD